MHCEFAYCRCTIVVLIVVYAFCNSFDAQLYEIKTCLISVFSRVHHEKLACRARGLPVKRS